MVVDSLGITTGIRSVEYSPTPKTGLESQGDHFAAPSIKETTDRTWERKKVFSWEIGVHGWNRRRRGWNTNVGRGGTDVIHHLPPWRTLVSSWSVFRQNFPKFDLDSPLWGGSSVTPLDVEPLVHFGQKVIYVLQSNSSPSIVSLSVFGTWGRRRCGIPVYRIREVVGTRKDPPTLGRFLEGFFKYKLKHCVLGPRDWGVIFYR